MRSLIFSILCSIFFLALPETAAAQDSHCAGCPHESPKTICLLGDSYVRNHARPFEEAWHYKAATGLGLRYENRGLNGSAIAFDRSAEGFGPRMVERLPLMPESADFIVIIAGHNDACKLETEGTMEQLEAEVGNLLDALAAKYPGGRIGWVLPWEVDRKYFPAVREAIKEICAKHSVAVLDIPAAVIDPNNADFRAEYFQSPGDQAHLNDAGHNLLVETGKEFFRSLMCESNSSTR